MRSLKVLGGGCAKCATLAQRTEEAARALGLAFELVKVQDMREIVAAGVMTTPALVVDGKVRVEGRLPSVAELKTMLAEGGS